MRGKEIYSGIEIFRIWVNKVGATYEAKQESRMTDNQISSLDDLRDAGAVHWTQT